MLSWWSQRYVRSYDDDDDGGGDNDVDGDDGDNDDGDDWQRCVRKQWILTETINTSGGGLCYWERMWTDSGKKYVIILRKE